MRIRKKQASATSDFEQFLKAYNCTYHVEKDKSATTYNFEFQAAQFVATIRSQNDCVEITYPCMSVVGIDYLDLVRSKCNERNNSNILFKFTYSIDHEENRLNVHLSFFNNSVTPELIAHELGAAFHFQREWQRDLDSAIDDSKDTKNHDLESDLYKYQREMFLLRRMEMSQQLDGLTANIASSTKALPLWKALETVAPLPAAHLLFMTVNTVNGQQQLKNEDEIRNFDLRRQRFIKQPWAQGVILLVCVLLAMLLANLPLTGHYYHSILYHLHNVLFLQFLYLFCFLDFVHLFYLLRSDYFEYFVHLFLLLHIHMVILYVLLYLILLL